MATGAAVVSGVTIRPLEPRDLEPLRWVIYRAYYEVLLELYGRDSASQYEVRSLDFMRMYLRRDPAGNFVAQTEDGTVAGGLFCFAWGEVGWFGSLAVAPELQGRGIAQQLTVRAVEYLRSLGCRRVGLETWPTAERTRHLYTKLGFEPGRTTLKLSRPLRAAGAAGTAVRMEWVSVGEQGGLERALQAVGEVTARAEAASGGEGGTSDYRNEVRVPVASGFGEVAVLRDERGEPVAFALVYVRKPSGAPVGALDVRLMVIVANDDERTIDALLVGLEARARELAARSLTFDVNLRFARAAALLRERGFRPIYELIRMEVPAGGMDISGRSTRLEYARWAG